MMRNLALAMMLVLAAPPVTWAQVGLNRGDLASVSGGGTTLVQDGETAAQLPENTWFEVSRTSGSWTAGHAYLDGEPKAGWVLTSKLAPESVEKQAQAAAEWEQLGARVERDSRGAVLSIDASESKIGDTQLAGIGVFPRLEELSLGGSEATAAGLAHLARLPRLRRLFLEGMALKDEAAQPLGKLKGLEGLSLANTQIGDAGVAHLSGLTRLQVLNLSNCNVTDAGLQHLAPLVNMETLALRNTKIRGAGLAYLRHMKPLNVLNLSQCPIEGEHLMHLAGMEHLRILHLADCNVDREYIDRLEGESTSLAVFD